MGAGRRVTDAVNAVLDLAPRKGEVTLTALVEAVGRDRDRSIEIISADLPPGVCGQWRQYENEDIFIIQRGLPTWDRTLAHELGHVVLRHEGISVVEMARDEAEFASDDLIAYMLSQRTGCMGAAGMEAEQEAEDFAALLLYRLGRLPSDRASIVQVRLGEAFWVIAWVIAGLLGMATGLRIGWVLVHKQSPVSTGMIVALGSLALVSALNWEPLTMLVDSSLGWPNISVAVSQAALTACAAGSCVMITSMSANRTAAANKRWARWQYLAAAVIAGASLAVFFARGRQPEMTPREFLKRDLGGFASGTAWLIPMLYIAVALSVVLWAGMAYSNRTRRGRALFLFTVGISLLVLAVLVVAGVVVSQSEYVTIGTAATLIGCAMAMVAVGSLLPTFETWLVARREMFVLAPLYKDLKKRQPDAAIGMRPRGPLAFQVADRMAYISDALFLEAMHAQGLDPESEGDGDIELDVEPVNLDVPPDAQAHAVVKWILTEGDPAENFPGPEWLHQPDGYSDREWILAIASEYRRLVRAERRS